MRRTHCIRSEARRPVRPQPIETRKRETFHFRRRRAPRSNAVATSTPGAPADAVPVAANEHPSADGPEEAGATVEHAGGDSGETFSNRSTADRANT